MRVPQDLVDPLADFLALLTGRGVCIREEGDAVAVDAYLDPENSEDHILRIHSWIDDLANAGEIPPDTVPGLVDVPEEDWMSVFRAQHKTVRISDRLVVRPTWCEPVDGAQIVLDPGLAFGTGSHGTTKMCLVLLDEATGRRLPLRMFDLGTGSGVLAIAGAFLGVGEVCASDIDPVAVEVAIANAEANGVSDRTRVVEGGVEAAEGVYGVVTANLSASLLKRLSPAISQTLEPSGKLIISGFMKNEKDQVLEAFSRCGLEPMKVLEEDVWCAAALSSTN
ncbi:MAG: 50S ribosomal protein L11 methyltransferase [bacterium]|nr:50S ribosomal protein L11 methyltransferase [bacterium]MDT8396088.1 50S ribosomal protein L11 methyltransferase [bacterium]